MAKECALEPYMAIDILIKWWTNCITFRTVDNQYECSRTLQLNPSSIWMSNHAHSNIHFIDIHNCTQINSNYRMWCGYTIIRNHVWYILTEVAPLLNHNRIYFRVYFTLFDNECQKKLISFNLILFYSDVCPFSNYSTMMQWCLNTYIAHILNFIIH